MLLIWLERQGCDWTGAGGPVWGVPGLFGLPISSPEFDNIAWYLFPEVRGLDRGLSPICPSFRLSSNIRTGP
jgi:hypothetical protein